MKIFKEKQYTLQEGHYTGPKDEVPGALKTVGGATLAGYVAGKVADKALEDPRKPVLGGDQPSTWATRGATTGFVGGIVAKLLLNTIHNPMDSIKFNDLDQCLRREFGMYRAAGVTIGDSRENQDKMRESFVINSKNLLDFKVNVSISKGSLTMYTLGLTPEQEGLLDNILDYYCKKYFGMKYTSTPLGNRKNGSWAITIVFTNHQVAANFLVEVGQTLKTRMNLLDNDISGDIKGLVEQTFSKIGLDKTELRDIFGKGVLKMLSGITASRTLFEMLTYSLERLRTPEKAAIGLKNPRESYGSKFLEDTMLRLDPRKIKWTLGINNSNLNIYLYSGTLLVCTSYGSKEDTMIKKIQDLQEIKEEGKNASLYTYKMKSPADLEVLLKRILGLGIKPNIYVS